MNFLTRVFGLNKLVFMLCGFLIDQFVDGFLDDAVVLLAEVVQVVRMLLGLWVDAAILPWNLQTDSVSCRNENQMEKNLESGIILCSRQPYQSFKLCSNRSQVMVEVQKQWQIQDFLEVRGPRPRGFNYYFT